MKEEAVTIETLRWGKVFLFITYLLVSSLALFGTSCERISKEEKTHIPLPSSITVIKKGQELPLDPKSSNFKLLSQAFRECLRNPNLKSDSGNTLEDAEYAALITRIHQKGNGIEVSYKLPLELTFWLNGQLQHRKWTKEYWHGKPTFLILLEGPYSGKMIVYDKGNPDPTPLFYYPVKNLNEIRELFRKVLK